MVTRGRGRGGEGEGGGTGGEDGKPLLPRKSGVKRAVFKDFFLNVKTDSLQGNFWHTRWTWVDRDKDKLT